MLRVIDCLETGLIYEVVDWDEVKHNFVETFITNLECILSTEKSSCTPAENFELKTEKVKDDRDKDEVSLTVLSKELHRHVVMSGSPSESLLMGLDGMVADIIEDVDLEEGAEMQGDKAKT